MASAQKAGSGEDHPDVSIDRLYRELIEETEASLSADRSPADQLAASVLATLVPDEEFSFDEELVKGNLDELLVVLVALRDSDTHGKGLMGDLASVFDAELSPGTVYPRLHELADDDVLAVHELVRTKEYRVDDPDRARDRVEDAMEQHLAMGFFLYAALRDL